MCLIFNLHTSQCICYKGKQPCFSHLSGPSLCFIPPSFEPTRGKKNKIRGCTEDTALDYNNVSSIKDFQWGQDHCVKHTVVRYKEQKGNVKKIKKSVIIVEKIAPKCFSFIVASS